MFVSRRKFLTTSAASAAVISGATQVPGMLLQAAAARSSAAGSDNVLVVVQLSGGNDGLNTVVPYADDVYGQNRFETRIGESSVHKIDDYLGLHPSLEGMHRLYQEQQLAIVQGVGYPNPNRSHFESMDIWHTAQPESSEEARRAGWLGKHLDARTKNAKEDVLGVHLGSEVQPLALAGMNVQVPSIGSFDEFRFEELRDPQVERDSQEFHHGNFRSIQRVA